MLKLWSVSDILLGTLYFIGGDNMPFYTRVYRDLFFSRQADEVPCPRRGVLGGSTDSTTSAVHKKTLPKTYFVPDCLIAYISTLSEIV